MGFCGLQKIKEHLDADLAKSHRRHDLTAEQRSERDAVRAPLIMRSFHLPDYNWPEDLWQFLTNNHPVLGICCHHRFHPVGTAVRILSLLGSVMFGLAVTNIVYIVFVFTDMDAETEYFHVDNHFAPSTGVRDVDANVSGFSVTNFNIVLWTIGSFVHSFYDNTVWALAACTCCLGKTGDTTKKMTDRRMKRYQSTGTFLVLVSAVVVTAVATLAVALTAALNNDTDGVKQEIKTNGLNTKVETFNAHTVDDFDFVIAYAVELALNYFVFYPIVGIILFSGLLTCGRCPLTGGRPYEVRQERLISVEKEEGTEAVLQENGTDVELAGSLPGKKEHARSAQL